MPESRQTLDPVFPIQLIPASDCVVEQQHLGDDRTTDPIVQQHQRIRPTGQPMGDLTAASQFAQVTTELWVEESATDHETDTNPSPSDSRVGFSDSRGVGVYTPISARNLSTNACIVRPRSAAIAWPAGVRNPPTT